MNAATEKSVDALGTQAADTAMRACAEYLRLNNVTVTDYDTASTIIRRHVKAAVGPALDDAKEALEAGMGQVASATFLASMKLAGFAAAKEIAESLKA